MFGQIDSKSSGHRPSEETSLSTTTGLIGYNFYDGGFVSTDLSNTQQFHYGIVHSNVDNFKILELPMLLKQRVGTNFHALFGAKINALINGGFTTLQLPEHSVLYLGTSLEMGLQYDVNKNFMMEMRFSLPVNQYNSVYSSVMDYNNTSLFRLGSEIRF